MSFKKKTNSYLWLTHLLPFLSSCNIYTGSNTPSLPFVVSDKIKPMVIGSYL